MIVASQKGLYQEIARLKRENERLRQELATDSLTRIGNRYAYDRRKKHKEGEIYIVLDVNHFKTINDTLGHEEGDRVLREIAQCIRSEADECYRYGGDEFVVIVVASSKEAQAIAERICQSVSLIETDCGPCSVSAGWGSTYAQADACMYERKHSIRANHLLD
jgi:diguanylate cyclase (GGDEF)-like protein